MSTAARKARKRAGLPAPVKPAKAPTRRPTLAENRPLSAETLRAAVARMADLYRVPWGRL